MKTTRTSPSTSPAASPREPHAAVPLERTTAPKDAGAPPLDSPRDKKRDQTLLQQKQALGKEEASTAETSLERLMQQDRPQPPGVFSVRQLQQHEETRKKPALPLMVDSAATLGTDLLVEGQGKRLTIRSLALSPATIREKNLNPSDEAASNLLELYWYPDTGELVVDKTQFEGTHYTGKASDFMFAATQAMRITDDVRMVGFKTIINTPHKDAVALLLNGAWLTEDVANAIPEDVVDACVEKFQRGDLNWALEHDVTRTAIEKALLRPSERDEDTGKLVTEHGSPLVKMAHAYARSRKMDIRITSLSSSNLECTLVPGPVRR